MTDRPPAARAVRADVQALRAVAVGLVVIYHVVPGVLPGGFAGVDVFFVISGFLITAILVDRPPRGVRDLVAFWGRRIRRLLPASLLVLLVSTLLSWAFLPATQWLSTARYVRAAALYVVNWVLASDAVDYLAEGSAPSIVQHYWSLSVEEQFYLVWPLLALLALGGRARFLQVAAMAAVVVASFAWSIQQTMTNPQVAYFSTFTRMWELGAGGLLSAAGVFAASWTASIRRSLATVGWVLIGVSGFVLNPSTPFPGWQASLPVVGTLLVLAASVEFRWHAWRPVRWLGDVSYSVYLWHWPLVVIGSALAGVGAVDRLGWPEAISVVLVTLVLAGLTKTFVEDRFRTPEWTVRIRATYLTGLLGMAAVVVAAGVLTSVVDHQIKADRDRLSDATKAQDSCFGAGALGTTRHCVATDGPLVPSPQLAPSDRGSVFNRRPDGTDCLARQSEFPVIACHFGDPKSSVRVVLIGNSHAAHWVPALQDIVTRKRWRVTVYLTSSCASSFTVPAFDTETESRRCVGWVKDVLARLRADPPDLVVMANHVGRPAWGQPSLEASYAVYRTGFRQMFGELVEIQRPIVVIRDTPVPIEAGLITSVPDCLAKHSPRACSGPRAQWIRTDPAAEAARSMHDDRITVVDLNDHFCDSRTCFGVVGGVVAYADGHHLTATFSRTLGPFLEPRLVAAIRQ